MEHHGEPVHGRSRRVARAFGVALIASAALGFGLLAANEGVAERTFAFRDTYFVVVSLSPWFLGALLAIGMALWLHGSRRTSPPGPPAA